ncbi:hypothetical protein, partial [Luteibaculum oceani]
FGFSDQSGCGFSDTLRTSYGCPCLSDAGSLVQDTLFACIGDRLIAQATSDYVLDSDDTLLYVLHTESGASLGNILHFKGSN